MVPMLIIAAWGGAMFGWFICAACGAAKRADNDELN